MWVYTDDRERFETAAISDPSIRELTPLSATTHPPLYTVDLRGADAAPLFTLLCSESATLIVNLMVTAEGCDFCLRLPNKETVARLLDRLEKQNVGVTIRSLSKGVAHPLAKLGLSDDQYEAVLLASERGYFAVPRETDLEELAAKLNTSSQTVSERLRRALETLLDRLRNEPPTD
ncbi:helix-turn-helix domain-containing protein [Halegenticoccus soli]|uniref:helix-turn-helix domain-containing protein n=1 Tax=Halegenticoccus soli TaxID=1985678 RepID=UPI0013041D79|nr:helix-turn-helix domain-containing protein [Halegenticoccus soli]